MTTRSSSGQAIIYYQDQTGSSGTKYHRDPRIPAIFSGDPGDFTGDPIFLAPGLYSTSKGGGTADVRTRKIIDFHRLPIYIQCFPADTPIQTSLTRSTPISALRIGDTVLAFDPTSDLGRGALVPRCVTRLFRNSTSEWIKLTWVDPASGGSKELVATPGHNMLDKFGRFTRLDALVAGNTCEIILSSGDCIMAQAERLVYSAATADMFERATAMAATSGALAIAPHALDAWATYNFEVEDLHTYVAGGVRVHNDSLFGPVTDLGRLGDNVASQISDFAFGHNTLTSVFAGSALRSVVSTLGDVFDPKAAARGYPAASFDVPHLAGRYIADVAGGLGAIGGSLLAQDLVSGLGIRGPLADALVQFGSGAGSLLAQEALLNVVSAVDPDGFFGAGAQDQLGKLGSIGNLAFGALGSFAGKALAGVLGLDPRVAPLVAAPIAAGISQIGMSRVGLASSPKFAPKNVYISQTRYNLRLQRLNSRAKKVNRALIANRSRATWGNINLKWAA